MKNMRTLQNIFQELKDYSYYPDVEKCKNAKEYIQGYFRQADKNKIANFLDKIVIDDMRYEHMRSTYMLGVWLYDSCTILQENINHELRDAVANDAKKEFLYRWYLTCLFHDVGYCYNQKALSGSGPQDFDVILKKIKDGITDEKKFLGSYNFIPEAFQKNFVTYYQTKIKEKQDSSIDHGIASAIKLFELLHSLHCDKQHTDVSGLQWGPEIFKLSVIPAVWYILAHNIWIASENTDRASKYKDTKLKALIQPIGHSLIDFEKHPMLFLLCFIDTIEPIKLLQKKDGNLTVEQCLKVVTMQVVSDDIHIGFDVAKSASSCLGSKFSDYYLAAIVKNLNFLVGTRFKIAVGDNEIDCHLQKSNKKERNHNEHN